MKTKKFSKIFCLVLAVALICTGLVLAVSADESTVDLAAAIDAAVADDSGMTTVTLDGNATLASAYTVTKDITVDLNGYTLTSTGADTFIIEGAYTVKIIGDGTVNIAGRLVKSSTVGAGYTFTMEGTTDISVNHTATAAHHIVHAAGGTHTFTKVNIRSTRGGGVGGNLDAFFRGTLSSEDNSGTGTAKDLKFYFNSASFTCESSPTAQNHITFMMPTGSGSYVEMNNSTVRNGGTLLYFGYTTETKMSTTLFEAHNTHLQLVSTDNRARSCLVWGHKCNGNGTDVIYGTVKLFDSYIGGNVYRAVHAGEKLTEKFQVVLDNSVIANNGANESTNGNTRDVLITRGAAVWLKNHSALVSGGTGLAMSSGKIYAEVGTRFNNREITSSSSLTWVDSVGDTVTGVSIVFDPVADILRPYVSTTDSTKTNYLPDGATNMNFFTTGYFAGESSQSAYGNRVDKTGSMITDWDNGWQSGFYNGALIDVTYGENNAFKYWVNPTSDYPTIGGNRKFPNNTTEQKQDAWFVLGINHNLSSGTAQPALVSNTKVAVSEFDIATDSEYGFPIMHVKTQARTGTNNGGDASGDTQFTIRNDGSISNGNLVNFDSSVTLSHQKWNHVTVVMYTDATYDEDGAANKIGQAFYYINGELLGYSNYAFKDTAGYVMGTRFTVQQNVNQVVGASVLIDNFSLRAYADYIGEGEADGAKKNPESYLLGDLLYNDQPVNLNITVAGRAYADINEAIKAANALGTNVQINGDIKDTLVVTENGVIDTNGYDVAFDPASYGFVKAGDKITFDEDYWYNVKWYVSDSDYISGVAKLGFELDHDNIITEEALDFEKLISTTQNGWAYTADATSKVTPLVPASAELEAAKANENRTVVFYPVITEVPMVYYVKNSVGEAYGGSSHSELAANALRSLPSGDTFVLNDDVTLTASALLFASTPEAPKTLNIDLNGHALSRSLTGVMFQVGAYTTLNVYSSVAGGRVIASTTNAAGAINDGGTCFVISDGTNNSASIAGKLLVETRGEVTEAYINVGKYGDIPGSNMTVIAERAYYGFKGGENCAITVDGVTTIAPGTSTATAIDTYVYDGDIVFKNAILVAPTKDNVVNIAAFSEQSKHTFDNGTVSPRLEGFEDVIITAGVRLENVIIVNNIPNIGGDSRNNVVANCGDDRIKALVFNNVVTTGRLNPSNNGSERVIMDGFVAAEMHHATMLNPTAGTVTAVCNVPMTWQSLDLGISDNVLNFTVTAYNAVTGELVDCASYNVANAGENAENAYSLPILTGATIYADDAAKINWNGIGGNANTKTEYYVPGTPYVSINAPDAAAYEMEAIKLVHDGAWTGIPAEGTVLTEDVTVTPGCTAAANISGMKANLSLYSDFLVNLYIPETYAQYITKVNGKALDAGTVTIGEAKFLKAIVAKNVKEASEDATFEIAITEGEYSATKTVNISITDYASQILAGGDKFADTDKALMYYMLNYVNEAAKYFAADNAENAEAKALLDANAQWNVISVDKSFANAVAQTGLESIFKSAGIVLNEAPAFTLTFGKAFTGKVTVTYGDGNERVFENINAIEDDKLVVEDMKIYNFATNLTVTVEPTEGEEVVGTVNLDTYAKYHTENAANAESATKAESEAALDLINALYDYVKVAEQYKGGTLTLPEADNGSEETPAE